MAKMKPQFQGIVEESFTAGYKKEPEITNVPAPQCNAPEKSSPEPSLYKPSENELLLRKLRAGDEAAINEILNHTDRKTYFITDLQRECISVKSREDDVTLQEVVQEALNRYFDAKTVEEAKREIIRKKIKHLEKEIEAESSSTKND